MNPPAPAPGQAPSVRPPYSWFDKFSAVVFCIFCLEVGVFLLFYPWVDFLWSRNWFLHLVPESRTFFMSRHFRGAVSGLGILNLFIGVVEVFRLRRFAAR